MNIQDACRGDDDEYDFDLIDGYDELRYGLYPLATVNVFLLTWDRSDFPEHQAKIRNAVEQGHVALEDFNGVCDAPDLQYGSSLIC